MDGASIVVLLFYHACLAISILVIAALWKVFAKANRPGWAAILPLYNIYVLVKIAGRPGWWLLLLLIPFVNLFISIIVYIELAESYGKSSEFGMGLVFLPVIFLPILGFGDAQYEGPAASASWVRRRWTALEADEWTKEDWIAIVLSPICYLMLTVGAALSLLLLWYGYVILGVSIVLTALLHWIIDPKLKAISAEYEKKQQDYLHDLEASVRWKKP